MTIILEDHGAFLMWLRYSKPIFELSFSFCSQLSSSKQLKFCLKCRDSSKSEFEESQSLMLGASVPKVELENVKQVSGFVRLHFHAFTNILAHLTDLMLKRVQGNKSSLAVFAHTRD